MTACLILLDRQAVSLGWAGGSMATRELQAL